MAGGHPIINPFGQVVNVSQFTIRTLDFKGYLHRDQASGLQGMTPEHWGIFGDLEFGKVWQLELGPDFWGSDFLICNCEECLGVTDYDGPAVEARAYGAIIEKRSAKKPSLKGYDRLLYVSRENDKWILLLVSNPLTIK